MKKKEIKEFREKYVDYDNACITEGLRLIVHFDEKDAIKQIGGRWEPDPSGHGGHWWISREDLIQSMPASMDEIIIDIFNDDELFPDPTVSRREWLNKNRMIEGPHGEVYAEAAKAHIRNCVAEPIQYHIEDSRINSSGTFFIYADIGVVAWELVSNGQAQRSSFLTIEQARTSWDELMALGFRLNSEKTS